MRKVLILLAVLVLSTGCLRHRTRCYDPSQVGFEVTYNELFEGQIYPSLILGMSRCEQSMQDSLPLLTASLTAPCQNAVVKIIVDSTTLNHETTTQVVMPRMGAHYSVTPAVKWRYDRLRELSRHGNLDLTVHCLVNDEEVDVKNLSLSYRPVNDCLLSAYNTNGRVTDFRWLFAGYVDEGNGHIDEVVSEMLRLGAVGRIIGYQQGAKEVNDQAEAIWRYVLECGMVYASGSVTSNPARRANVQNVRFFDEVYEMRMANCIDACVFFASVMRGIGLKPVIFMVPGHAYLGYYTDKEKKNVRLLETTVSQWVNFPELTRIYNNVMDENPEAHGKDRLPEDVWTKYSKYLTAEERTRWTSGTMTIDELKGCVAHYLFQKASDYNVKNHKENAAKFRDEKEYQYQMLDIEELRSIVQPI